MTALAQTISTLPVEERLQIIWDIWDSIEAEWGPSPVPEEDIIEMERRAEEYYKDGNPGDSWDVVRKRIEAKLKL
ncbi:MAG: addiction module protein [Candidatus Kapaibacterium sp.]